MTAVYARARIADVVRAVAEDALDPDASGTYDHRARTVSVDIDAIADDVATAAVDQLTRRLQGIADVRPGRSSHEHAPVLHG